MNYLTLASFQTRRSRWGATITLVLSIPLSPSFYFNESTINKEMERLPKGGWFLHNGSLLLSIAVLNSPYKATGPYWRPSPVSPHHHYHHHLSIACSFFSLILKVSRANLCHSIIWSPPPPPLCSKCRLYNTSYWFAEMKSPVTVHGWFIQWQSWEKRGQGHTPSFP